MYVVPKVCDILSLLARVCVNVSTTCFCGKEVRTRRREKQNGHDKCLVPASIDPQKRTSSSPGASETTQGINQARAPRHTMHESRGRSSKSILLHGNFIRQTVVKM